MAAHYWLRIPGSRFEEIDTAFGQWEGVVYGLMQYWIDNEIHRRATCRRVAPGASTPNRRCATSEARRHHHMSAA
jgi:hypothetical protein